MRRLCTAVERTVPYISARRGGLDIGDPLTLAAGVLREPFWSFISIVAFAKLARYLVVAGITFQWLGMIP